MAILIGHSQGKFRFMTHIYCSYHKVVGLSSLLIVSLFDLHVPAQAQSMPTLAAVKATEQFVKMYDPTTSSISFDLNTLTCETSKFVSNPNGYSRVCLGNSSVLLSPVEADVIEKRDGMSVLSYITANGLARARQASVYQKWGTHLDLAAIADAQSECLSGVYLKAALPVVIPNQDLNSTENYIKKTGSQSQTLIPVPGKPSVRLVVNGTIRAMAFRYGYDAGDLKSCFVTTDPSRITDDSIASRLKLMLSTWTVH